MSLKTATIFVKIQVSEVFIELESEKLAVYLYTTYENVCSTVVVYVAEILTLQFKSVFYINLLLSRILFILGGPA